MNSIRHIIGLASIFVMLFSSQAPLGAGTWTPLVNDPTFLNGTLCQMLLTDALFLCEIYGIPQVMTLP